MDMREKFADLSKDELLNVLNEYDRCIQEADAGFSHAIDEIMPLVRDIDAAKLFIITRDSAYGDWQVCYPTPENAESFLESQREIDPCVEMFTGADFSGGSYSFVCDKVLLARFAIEEQVILKKYAEEIGFGAFDAEKLNVFRNALEDNFGELSPEAAAYLTTIDEPLEWLYAELAAPQKAIDETDIASISDAIEKRIVAEATLIQPLTAAKPQSPSAPTPPQTKAEPSTLLDEIEDAKALVAGRDKERGIPLAKSADEREV